MVLNQTTNMALWHGTQLSTGTTLPLPLTIFGLFVT